MPLPEILDELLTSLETGPRITATRHFPARAAVFAPFPSSLDPRIVESLRTRGVTQLYSHQARAFDIAAKGEHLVVVTPTASGKTLCYNLPVLQALVQQPDARVLYLFPTKALAQDQLAELTELARTLPDMRMFTYDGDTPQDARRAVRARANLVLSNPDMLHSGILPHHTKWVNLFQNLRYVVIDELHAYRGVFGSHLANVLRRLKRICRHYGAAPQFIMASATIANPRELAERLTGEAVTELAESGAPTGDKLFVCYNPPVVNPELGIRAPYLGEASMLAARFLKAKVATIVFCQSRLATEVVLANVKKAVEDRTGDAGIVRGYRGGYLPLRRREVEQGLRAGEVLGVITTSALELGIDIGAPRRRGARGLPGNDRLDVAAGRARGPAHRPIRGGDGRHQLADGPVPRRASGLSLRRGAGARAHQSREPVHPRATTSSAARSSCPSSPARRSAARSASHLAALEEEGLLHRAGASYHWTSETYPADHLSLRTVTSDNFLVIDTTARDAKQTKRRQIIAEVDWKSAFSMIYPKAIYMVEGEPFEVQELHYREDEEKVAYVKKVVVDYFTDAISAKGVWILRRLGRQETPGLTAEQGEVLVAEKVVGFKKIKMGTLENVGSGEVELPQQEMQTTSVWLTVDPALLARISSSREELVDGLRALTYLLHHLAPTFLLCDVRDVGAWLGDGSPAEAGVVATRESTRARLLRAEEFTPTIHLYDNQPGGIGLAERVFEVLHALLGRGLETLEACACKSGCPSCVGPVNEVGRRAKPIARALLSHLVTRR